MTQDPFTARRAKVVNALLARGWQGLAVAPGDNFRYLTGFSPTADERPCYLLLAPDGEAFIVPVLNAAQAREHITAPTFTYEDADGPQEALAQALATLPGLAQAGAAVAVDDPMRSDFLLQLSAALNQPKIELASEVIAPIRMVKDEEEREILRQSALLADRAVRAVVSALRPGVSERDMAKVARAAFEEAGADHVNFVTVAFGDNAAFPHHHSSDRTLKQGEPVLMDFGCSYHGYGSDITRVAYLGEPSERYRQVHAVVEEAVLAALAAVRPGATAGEVDEAARRVIRTAGFGDAFVHRTGHGIGLTGHEQPWIRAGEQTVLQEGMAFSIEPGIYLTGDVGVRLEEIVLVGSHGPEVLSRLPRDIWRV